MAVNRKAVKQVQHQYDEHQLIQSPDNTEVQYPPRGEEKARKGANNRGQMRRIGRDDSGYADIQ